MHKVNWFLSTLFFFAATALPAQSPDFSGRYEKDRQYNGCYFFHRFFKHDPLTVRLP